MTSCIRTRKKRSMDNKQIIEDIRRRMKTVESARHVDPQIRDLMTMLEMLLVIAEDYQKRLDILELKAALS